MMYKNLRALLTLCLVLILGLAPVSAGWASSLDYSVAVKLEKQLQAGSGFTGTLTLSMAAAPGREKDAIITKEPLVFDLSYLAAREDAIAGTPAERRLSLLYPSGADPRAAFYLSLKEAGVFLKSSLLDYQWYALQSAPLPEPPVPEETKTPAQADAPNTGFLAEGLQETLQQSVMPSLLPFLASMAVQGNVSFSDDFTKALNVYTTKIDLWIEGYRQNAALGKLADGTVTMEVSYAIPALAIKAQLKQMVLDVLADATLLPMLQAMLPSDQAELMLNPQMQSYYFFAIDSLPLDQDLTIARTVSLKGETLSLHMQLPFYDEKAGAVTLAYSRSIGEGDLPDENVISLENKDLTLRLEYQEYSTMTDVIVYQGTLLREPHGLNSYEVEDAKADLLHKTLSADFTLTHGQSTSVDSEEREILSHDIKLSVQPTTANKDEGGEDLPLTQAQQAAYLDFPALDISATAIFASKPAKNASTSLDLSVVLASEDLPQEITLKLEGKTVLKWPLDAFAVEDLPSLTSLSQEKISALLGSVAFQAGSLFLPHFQLPTPAGPTAPTASPQGTVD